jgi:hypothetical protein
MERLVAIVQLLLIAGMSHADGIAPGYQRVSHSLQINNLKDHPDYVFFVYPKYTDFARGAAERFDAGKSVSVTDGHPAAYTNMRFYAVPKSLYEESKETPKENWFNGKEAGVLESEDSPHIQRNIRKSSRITRIVSEYEVTIKDGKLKVEEVARKYFDGDDKEVAANSRETEDESSWYYLGIPAVAAILIVAMFLFRRKRVA